MPLNMQKPFSSNFYEWLKLKLKSGFEFSNIIGIGIVSSYVVACWFIWKLRCSRDFDNQYHTPTSLYQLFRVSLKMFKGNTFTNIQSRRDLKLY